MLKKILIAALLFIVHCSLFIVSYAQEQPEQITITTYYPSPYGSYDQLTTTGNTTLATNPGSVVGIGTTTVDDRLDVNGTIDATSYKVGGTAGYNGTIIVRDSAGTGSCTITVTDGIITETNCL